MWYRRVIGGERTPIVDTWWQTETGGIMISPLPGVTTCKPGSAMGPLPGIGAAVVDDHGDPVGPGGGGYLVLTEPWPAMLRGIWGDNQRYVDTYWSRWPGVWVHGDWATVDEDGYWYVQGRSDDTLKIAGKRLGPAEVESVLVAHPAVAEAAAIGVPHEIKGEAVVCFVVLKPGRSPSEPLREELKEQVVKHLGKTLKPEALKFVRMLPKTRSAKIVRGAIKKAWLGETPGDTASIENPDALEEISKAT